MERELELFLLGCMFGSFFPCKFFNGIRQKNINNLRHFPLTSETTNTIKKIEVGFKSKVLNELSGKCFHGL